MGIFDFLKPRGTRDLRLVETLAVYLGDTEISKQLKKGLGLRELGRKEEAEQHFRTAHQIAKSLSERAPMNPSPKILEALVLLDWEKEDEACSCMESIIRNFDDKLDQNQRNVLRGHIQDIVRRRKRSVSAAVSPQNFTQVYVCRGCGRLINYISLPCVCCLTSQQNISDMSTAYLLSSQGLSIPQLIAISRRMKSGGALRDVIGNLDAMHGRVVGNSAISSLLEQALAMARDTNFREDHAVGPVRCCPACECDLISSYAEECASCGARIRLTDLQRICICADNLLAFVEDRMHQKPTEELNEFVCFLVWLRNQLLVKQRDCDAKSAATAIGLVKAIGAFADKNGGAIVSFHSFEKPEIYLVREKMLDDTEVYAKLLFAELHRLLNYLGDRASRA